MSLFGVTLSSLAAATLLLVAGIGGFSRESFLTGLGFPPLAFMLALVPWTIIFGRTGVGFGVLVGLAWVASAVAFVRVGSENKSTVKALFASSTLMGVAFLADSTYANVTKVDSYSMRWEVGGTGHFDDGPSTRAGQPKVLIYRCDGSSARYDRFYSNEIASRLQQSNKRKVKVEYNTVYSFGKEIGDNIRSIDGLKISDGMTPVILLDGWQAGSSQSFDGTTCDDH